MGALRRLFEKHGWATPPLPTSLDLYRELQEATPAQFKSLLHDLFEQNMYWELETEGTTAEQTEAGAWKVTLNVQAPRQRCRWMTWCRSASSHLPPRARNQANRPTCRCIASAPVKVKS